MNAFFGSFAAFELVVTTKPLSFIASLVKIISFRSVFGSMKIVSKTMTLLLFVFNPAIGPVDRIVFGLVDDRFGFESGYQIESIR